MKASILLAGTVASLGLLSGCVKNATTGKTILTFGMSHSEQAALGAQTAPQFTQEMGGKIPSPQLQSYVDGIGKKLAALTEGDAPSYPWEFNLVNTSDINAFALPGGKVFFTRGLAERLTTEAQMAGVIGHEIGHVAAEHGAQRIAKETLFSGAAGVAGVIVGSSSNKTVQELGTIGVPALSAGGSLVLLKYGRNEELEADRLGVRYMTKAGYNPHGQLEVMQLLQKLSAGSSQPTILSTHPDPAARIDQIQQLLAGDYKYTQGDPKYQDFADRYKTQFLDVLKKLPPPPPPPKQADAAPSREQLAARSIDAKPVDFSDPTTWCERCRASAAGAKPTTARRMLASAMMRSE
jgi:predicted Zn-dependent protease